MHLKKLLALGLSLTMAVALLSGCGQQETAEGGTPSEQVIIYSNADEEAITAMTNALNAGGYAGQYVFQTFGTSELGGKLLAEGTNLEADLVTMSTF